MIPRIIHQVWEGRTEYLGETFQALGETWKKCNPNWKYEFWDEYRMDSFIYDHFPEMVDVYFGYPYGIQRWHVIRYLILYKIGGLYVDFDYECIESFDKYILDENRCYFAMEPERHCTFTGKQVYFNNALMISPQNHSFFKEIITHLRSESISYWGEKELEVLNTTGALMLTDLYEKYADKNTVAFFPSALVSPFSKRNIQDYIHGKIDETLLEEKMQKAIAIHYFTRTWLNGNCLELSLDKKLMLTPIQELYRIFTQHPIICTDEKKGTPNSIFFAIQGETYNGNLFAEKALDNGCCYAVVDDPAVVIDKRYLLVDNVQKALEQLADYHHQKLGTPVIAITGTCGKTTTKELIVSVLSTQYKLVYTFGSENAALGASLTLLRLKSEHDMAVIEMGACRLGMIREVTRIVRPKYGIITNVGLAHLNGFGSFEGVLCAKKELYDYLHQFGGIVFIHKGNEYLQSMAEGLTQISYGESDDALVSGCVVSSDPFLCLNWENGGIQHTVNTHFVGDYNLLNVLAAITVGIYFHISHENVNQAISNYIPLNGRSQWMKTTRNKLIIDTFNANPYSMHAALISFSKLSAKPKAVILGDMLGLGPESLNLHLKIIELLKKCIFDRIYLCGNMFAATNSGYSCFIDVESLSQYLLEDPLYGYNVLIKGSNKMYLGKIIHLL